MSILTKFNDSPTYNFEKIHEDLKMKPEIAAAALQAIVKTDILVVVQGAIENGDAVFAINEKFSK